MKILGIVHRAAKISRSVLTLRGLSENRALGDGASHHSPSSCSIVTGHSDLALDSASQVVAHVHGEVVVKLSSTANYSPAA